MYNVCHMISKHLMDVKRHHQGVLILVISEI